MCPVGAPKLEVDVQRYTALLQMADVVSHQQDPAELFRALTPILQNVIAFDFINFALHDPVLNLMQLHVWQQSSWLSAPLQVSIGEAAAGEVWRSQESLYIDDLRQEHRFASGLRWLRDYDLQSYCVFPLTTARQRLGALGFGSRKSHSFSPHDLEFLNRVAEMVALCVQGTLSKAALGAKALLEAETALASSLDLPQLFAATERSLQKVAPHEFASVAYFDDNLGVLRQHSLEIRPGDPPPRGSVLQMDDPFLGTAFRRQELQVFHYQELERIGSPVLHAALKKGVRSICLLPLATAKGRLGTICLQSTHGHAFASETVPALKQLSGLIALAFDNVLAHRHLRLQRERMQALARINALLAANWDVHKIFPKLSAHLRHVLHHEYASIVYHDERENRLIWQATDFPLSKGFLKAAGASLDISQAPTGKALISRAAMVFSRNEIAAFGTEFTARILEEGLRTLCCVPLSSNRGSLGTLNIASTRENAFGPQDCALLRQIAGQITIAIENARAVQQIEQLKNLLAEEKEYLEGEIRTEIHFEDIIGESRALKEVLHQVATVASSDATVLVLGETGTGKELIARAIHRISPRNHKEFIKLNCAAIPTGLLESELFGHEKGAFTGAVSQKIGRMELAHGGTLFLDEIGEIPLELQPKLLRVLQDQEFERLGGNRTIKVNVRLVAATNRDLATSVEKHEFRSDLFYRLNVFPIRMPPLRERFSDIPLLVRHFVHKHSEKMGKTIDSVPAKIRDAIASWHWPGNIRELENFIERSIILTHGTVLRAPLSELQRTTGPRPQLLETSERDLIIRMLRETRGKLSGPDGAAHRLGVKRTTLQSKMLRLGITREDYLPH